MKSVKVTNGFLYDTVLVVLVILLLYLKYFLLTQVKGRKIVSSLIDF